MWSPGKGPINDRLTPRSEAIDQPDAGQIQHGRALIESRHFWPRIPDDSIVVTDRGPTSVPGAGRYYFAATGDTDGTYAMVHAPIGRGFQLPMAVIKTAKVKAGRCNPRGGKATAIGTFDTKGEREFMPPDKGEMIDYGPVLDEAAKGYSSPGRSK